MSHSRNRRPTRTQEAPRKAPADYATNNVKEQGGTKDKIKIPRNVRYDLENALLGLCDVWFEEIKPHLVKNKLKLHTGGALNENGYGDLELPKELQRDGRRTQLDPDSPSSGGDLQSLLANAARSIESALSQSRAALANLPNKSDQSL